jgi:hypothetical protein
MMPSFNTKCKDTGVGIRWLGLEFVPAAVILIIAK